MDSNEPPWRRACCVHFQRKVESFSVEEGFQFAAREPAKRERRDRLGGIGEGVGIGDAQEITGSDETGHLAPAVGQHLGQAHRALGHVVDVLGGVPLVEDGFLAVHPHPGDEGVQAVQLLAAECRADAHVAHRTGLAGVADATGPGFRKLVAERLKPVAGHHASPGPPAQSRCSGWLGIHQCE
jgi:hypothetical protein